jgi:hypothetical protein
MPRAGRNGRKGPIPGSAGRESEINLVFLDKFIAKAQIFSA